MITNIIITKTVLAMYHNILLAVDLSEYSEDVARKAWELATHFDAKLYMIYVKPTNSNEQQTNALLKTLADNHFIQEEHLFIASGNITTAIMEKQQALNIDAIVLGSRSIHDKSASEKGNAYDIIKSAPCDVVVVRYQD